MPTKAKARTIQDVRKDLEEVRRQIAEWESEESTLKTMGELDWEGANDPGRLEQAIEAERRLGQLPAQLRAARIKATQLEIEELELQEIAAAERIEDLYSEMEAANEQLQAAQQVARQASGRWHDARYKRSDLRRERDRLKNQVLYSLKQERVTEAEKGPIVRAAWLASQYDAGTEEGVEGDAPGSFGFGSANVGDQPLSAQGEREATVVVPEGALERHRKGGGGG